MPERFSASVAARHMACHASAQLDLAVPGWTPPVVDEMAGAKGEGTLLHEVFALAMAFSTRHIENLGKALAYVAELRTQRRFKVLIEQSIEATWLKGRPRTTVDLVLYTQDELHVLDLKTGRILVEAYDNKQLLYYAACFMHLAPKAKGVWLHIIQPWADNMEAVWVTAEELAQFIDHAQQTEAAIANGSVSFGPSDECKFCPANPHSRGDKGKPLCPAMMKLLYPAPFDEDEILGT